MSKYNKKCFHLSINEKSLEKYDKILSYLTGLQGLIYILVTEHIGQENKHYHVYVQYENTKKLSIKKLYGSHVEKCYANARDNIKYLKCEDKKHKKLGVTYKLIYEQGEPRFNGGYRTVGDLRECENSQELPAIYYNIRKRIREDYEILDIEDLEKEVEVFWIQGESGIGKTNKAKEIVREKKEKYGTKINMVKYENSFWLGVKGEVKVAIYDDFRDSHMKPSEFINFIDYNKHYLNIKNGSKLNNYNLIIITSVQKLENIYMNVSSEPRKQWERRINVINMYEN